MDHEGPTEPNDKRSDPPSEGVRIIGAEEAAEALERGDVTPRRSEDEPRFGDRPTPPDTEGPRPVLRFPLGSSSDPRDVDRPAVAPSEPVSEPVELPHWTEPPTGQVPSIGPDAGADDDDLDDWAGFAATAPRWRDDASGYDDDVGFDDVAAWADEDEHGERPGALDDRDRPTHDDYFSFADLDEAAMSGSSVFRDSEPRHREDDPWEDPVPEPTVAAPAHEERPPRRTGERPRRATPAPRNGRGSSGDRDMGQAVVVGVGLLALALVLFNIGPAAAMVLVTVVLGVAVAELYAVARQAGYEPIVLAGVTATAALAVGAYNYGPAAVPTILYLATAVSLLWYLVGAGRESPVLNAGVTMFGVLWVGVFGSFAALMLGLGEPGIGVLLAAILGTVGYDIGGFFVGRNAGRQPLSEASPNKTVEGLIGGCAISFVTVVAISVLLGFGPIDTLSEGALVGLVVALVAPLGDLCESLVKRDLGVKDMGTLLPGHGGVLDRIDALLFVVPAVWLLATVTDFFA